MARTHPEDSETNDALQLLRREPATETVELIAQVALAASEDPVCWVAVEGIPFPIPITKSHPRFGTHTKEPRRIRIPYTQMYLQYAPADGVTPEGAALYYVDMEGGREVLRHDRVWYGTGRTLPHAAVTRLDHNGARHMCAYRTENEARLALGLCIE